MLYQSEVRQLLSSLLVQQCEYYSPLGKQISTLSLSKMLLVMQKGFVSQHGLSGTVLPPKYFGFRKAFAVQT